jgi:uncharacterized membrane protein YjjP (DUF1212 family)
MWAAGAMCEEAPLGAMIMRAEHREGGPGLRFAQRNHSGGFARLRRGERTGRFDKDLLSAVHGPELPDESTMHMVIDLALRIGEVQMSSGAGAADVTATIYAITNAYGLPHCEVDVIYTSITISCHRGRQFSPVTAVRVVRSRGSDYTRLADTEKLAARITAGKIAADDATAELDRITTALHPYPRWVATVAFAGLAACISVLIGGNGLTASIAAVVTALVDRVGRRLNKRGLPFFFQQMIGGALATSASLLIVYSGLFSKQLQEPSLIIAAAITVLLSGLSVVGTVQDAVTGYNVTAAGRSIEVALMSIGLIAGVVIALKLAVELARKSGIELSNVAPRPGNIVLTTSDLPVQVVTGGGAAAFFALASYATVRALLVAGGAGSLGALLYYSLQLVGLDLVTTSALAALLIGLMGGVWSRRLRIPPVIVAVSGLTPLLPGMSTYRALSELIVDQNSAGLGNLMLAIAIALALGAGVVFGEFIGQPVRTGLGRLERKFSGPRMAGPLRAADRPLE